MINSDAHSFVCLRKGNSAREAVNQAVSQSVSQPAKPSARDAPTTALVIELLQFPWECNICILSYATMGEMELNNFFSSPMMDG